MGIYVYTTYAIWGWSVGASVGVWYLDTTLRVLIRKLLLWL